MGACCSYIRREQSFQEDQRRKSRDQGALNYRRKSSALSRYSDDGRHVLESPLRIAAFNVQDKTEKSLYSLLAAVNERPIEASQFKLIASPRLGRSDSKEQYAFFYRADRVDVLDSDVYPDEAKDTFIREPFVVKFSSGAVSCIDHFVIIAIHTQPKDAFKEIDNLVDVHKWAEKRMSSENVIIAGDLNAGGSYVRPADWAMCRLRGPQYGWLIADHQDTTATNTLAAYDRILTCSHSVHEAVVTDSAGVYRFDEDLGLDEETTLKVSDHFPVFCSLKPSVHPAVMKNIQTLMAIYVVDKRLPNLDLTYLSDDFKQAKFKLNRFYNFEGDLSRVEIRSGKLRSGGEVVRRLSALRDSVAGLVSYSALATIKYKLVHAAHLGSGTSQEFFILISVDVDQKRTHFQVQYNTEITA